MTAVPNVSKGQTYMSYKGELQTLTKLRPWYDLTSVSLLVLTRLYFGPTESFQKDNLLYHQMAM